MQLENRYFVVKWADLSDDMTPDVVNALETVTKHAENNRLADGTPPLDCIVLEKHWPEYQLALDAIAHRVDGTSPWQLIDFGQAELEQPPFDGKDYLIRGETSCVVASWKYECFAFNTGDGVLFLDRERLTHWMPVPEFMKGGDA